MIPARFSETALASFQTSGLGTAHIQIWPCAPVLILHSYLSKCRVGHIVVILTIEYYVGKCDYVNRRSREMLIKRQRR